MTDIVYLTVEHNNLATYSYGESAIDKMDDDWHTVQHNNIAT